MWCGVGVCMWCVCAHLVGGLCVHVVCLCVWCVCACARACEHTMLSRPWREGMNALAGEEGEALPRAAQSRRAPSCVQKRQECFASGKLILPSRTKNPIKERMREM